MKGFLHLSYVIPGTGIRTFTARITHAKRGKLSNIVYPQPDDPGDPCTQPKHALYMKGEELRIRVPQASARKLKRFLRDYVRFSGGGIWSMQHYITAWR